MAKKWYNKVVKINLNGMVSMATIKQGWSGTAVAVLVGVAAILIGKIFKSPILDPLFVALVIGIILRSVIKFNANSMIGFKIAPMLFLPIGVILYGAVNLNFVEFSQVHPLSIFAIIFVFLCYAGFVYLLSFMLRLDLKTAYLILTGSAICGASAIAIASDAVEAEPDNVSKSLISVFISALAGLFIFLPIAGIALKMSGADYGIMAGALLQFTGFVKAAILNLPVPGDIKELMPLALSVKAARYMGLIFLIPLLASSIKRRFYVPWYMWLFVLAGLIFSFVPGVALKLSPASKEVLNYLWSIAMGAIGLNASIRVLFSKEGVKSLAVAFISFILTALVFLAMYIPTRSIIF